MTGIAIQIYLIGLLIGVAFVSLAIKPVSWHRSLARATPLTLFSIAAWSADASPFFIAAMVFAAAGDLAHSREGRAPYLYGIAAFSLTHLCLTLAFAAVSGGAVWDAFVLAPLAAISVLALAFSTEVWLIWHTGALRWPVRTYVGLALIMVLSALTLPTGGLLVQIGAVLFIVSGILLAGRRFRMPPDSRWAQSAAQLGWGLYLMGQALIMWGFVLF